MNLAWLKIKGQVKAVFSPPIPYWPLLESGDSSPYFGTYEGQKYGLWDTNCCWDFSAAELAETRLELLEKLGLIPQESLDWAIANGYKDSDGDWYLSRRWVAILSGVRSSGNFEIDFWRIASVAGLIPNKMLPYSVAEASKWLTREQFDNEYFNPDVITLEMELLGKEFARRFNIRGQNITGGYFNDISTILTTYLKEGSLQIGHPVPQDDSWNRVFVNYPVGRIIPDHATEIYKFDLTQAYPFFIYDSYQPNLKQLSKNYFIPYITRVSIRPLTITKGVQTSVPTPVSAPVSAWMKFWFNVAAWITGKQSPYPSIPIGKS